MAVCPRLLKTVGLMVWPRLPGWGESLRTSNKSPEFSPDSHYQESPRRWGGGTHKCGTWAFTGYCYWCQVPLSPVTLWRGQRRELEKQLGSSAEKTGSLNSTGCDRRDRISPRRISSTCTEPDQGKRAESTHSEESERKTSIEFLKSYTLMVEVRTDNRGSSTR